ncbi:hypothetical protein [uncultured Albimonas sp.]|uniref:hypothetical protein n=1 Tax=uncultured Albimonas sp. TaxID=1331701 RepID=UPI0030EE4B60
MVERNLTVPDTPLRDSVMFKVVQTLHHARRRKLVRMIEKMRVRRRARRCEGQSNAWTGAE